MPNTSSSKMPSPAVLRFRGLDLEVMTAQQMRNIDAIRRMANLMFDSTKTITERQAAFFKASAEQMGGVFESEDGLSDSEALFERQTEAYRVLFGALARHVGEFADITSKCCAGLVQEATGNTVGLPVREGRTEQLANRAGCCCGPSKEAARNTVDRAIGESRSRTAPGSPLNPHGWVHRTRAIDLFAMHPVPMC